MSKMSFEVRESIKSDDAIRSLDGHKDNLNVIDAYGDTPLSLAVKLHNDEAILQLVKNPSLKIELSDNNNPPFHIYCEEGILKLPIFQVFAARVSMNRMINRRNYEGKTPLHCLLNNPTGIEDAQFLKPFIQKLLDLAADLTIQDAFGDTPLMSAIDRRYPYDILLLLIPTKDFLNLKNKAGFNALSLCLLKYQGEIQSPSLPRRLMPSDPLVVDFYAQRATNNRLSLGVGSSQRNLLATTQRKENVGGELLLQLLLKGPSANGLAKKTVPDPFPVNDNNDEDECSLFHHLILKLIPSPFSHLDLFVMKDSQSRRHGLGENNSGKLDTPRETLLSQVIQNKNISFRTIRLLLQKSLIQVTPSDLWSCLLYFRLDVLDEIISEASFKHRGNPFFLLIKNQESLAINIIDHVFSNRHIYLSQSTPGGFMRVPSPAFGNRVSTSLTSSVSFPNPIVDDYGLPEVTRKLARYNLTRVKPILSRLFQVFGHDVNHVIEQEDPRLNDGVQAFTVIHAFIQAHSWVPMPDVCHYLLNDMKGKLDINVQLEGRGTPLNYAIRLGQFELADRLLDLGASTKDLDLYIPVVPLKRGFYNTMTRLMRMGVRIPPQFGEQIPNSSCINDASLEVEYFMFLKDVKEAQHSSRENRQSNGRYRGHQQNYNNGYHNYHHQNRRTFHARKNNVEQQ